MKKYFCKTSIPVWDEFELKTIVEKFQMQVWADSKSEAEEYFLSESLDFFQLKQNPGISLLTKNLTIKQIKP